MAATVESSAARSAEVAKANLEYWQATELYAITGALFGEIDHLIRTERDLIARGWIVECCAHNFEIKLKLYDTVIAPLIRGDLRSDVLRSFPSLPTAERSGVVFVFENCSHFDNPIQLYWRLSCPNRPDQDIPLEKKSVISERDLYEV